MQFLRIFQIYKNFQKQEAHGPGGSSVEVNPSPISLPNPKKLKIPPRLFEFIRKPLVIEKIKRWKVRRRQTPDNSEKKILFAFVTVHTI